MRPFKLGMGSTLGKGADAWCDGMQKQVCEPGRTLDQRQETTDPLCA